MNKIFAQLISAIMCGKVG